MGHLLMSPDPHLCCLFAWGLTPHWSPTGQHHMLHHSSYIHCINRSHAAARLYSLPQLSNPLANKSTVPIGLDKSHPNLSAALSCQHLTCPPPSCQSCLRAQYNLRLIGLPLMSRSNLGSCKPPPPPQERVNILVGRVLMQLGLRPVPIRCS